MDLNKTLSEVEFWRQHLQLFCLLLFAVPPLSFVAIKFWLSARAATKVQRTKQWYVPKDLDSEAVRILFDGQPAPAFSTRQIHADPRRAAMMAGAAPKRRS